MPVQRSLLARLIDRERAAYLADRPRSAAAFAAAAPHLLGGVPMTWMGMWSGGFPLYLESAAGRPPDRHRRARPTSTSASATPARWPVTPRRPVRGRLTRRYGELGGATTMLPTEDAAWVAAELTRRFGLTLLELHADRDGRQPVGDPARPAADRAAEDPRLFATATTAAWTSRFIVATPGRPALAGGERGRAGRPAGDDQGRASSTTRPPWSGNWRTATSRPC